MGRRENHVLADDGPAAVGLVLVVARVAIGEARSDLDLGDPGVVAVLAAGPVQNAETRLQAQGGAEETASAICTRRR